MTQPRLLHNIAALGVLQAVNYLLVLITLPVVTRALGVESWGNVAFVLLILNYLLWVTNWSFHLSATRKIAANHADPSAVSQIFMATWAAQWILASIVLITLAAIVILAPIPAADRWLYILGSGLVIGNVLFPSWFLNGLEKMKEAAIMQIIAKVPTVPLIIALVNDKDDGALYIAINALSAVLTGLLALAWIRAHLSVRWFWPGWVRVYGELRDGAALFATTAWISLYSNVAPTVLAVLVGPVAVGIYTLADRARAAAQAVLAPVTQALYPRMSRLYITDRSEAARLISRSGLLIASVSGLISIGLWALADPIIFILGGIEFHHAADLLRWLAPVPMMMGLSALFGTQIMLPAGKAHVYNMTYALAGILNFTLIIPLISWRGVVGAPMSALITESFVTTMMCVYLLKNGFLLGKPILR
jgi:PST family polysaccharide transporter